MSLFLIVLVGFAALAVDIGHGYFEAQRAQNAADAAALAGTVYLPGDPATAVSTAQAVAATNGFPGSVALVTAAQQNVKTQLKVTVTEDVKTWFAKAIGFSNMHISRSATADYDQPVGMGSPSNTFGNQPSCSGTCSTGDATPQFWASVAGPDTAKVQGNAFSSRWCGSSAADNCAENSYGNSDYTSAGYYYLIRNNGTGGPLTIQVFDAPFVGVNSDCSDGALSSIYSSSGNNVVYKPGPWGDGTNGSSPYCTGDQAGYPDPDDNAPISGNPSRVPTVTRYTVLAPDSSPWDYTDNPVLCDTTMPGYANATAAWNDVTNGRTTFRKWWTACTVNNPVQGDYVLQVRTTSGAGSNQFAIRADYNNTPSNATGVSIFASARMGLFANAPGSNNTNFYLARVLPGAAGRTLKLDFFDIGDAGNTGSVQVVPPTDAKVNGAPLSVFTGCKYAVPPGNTTGPPWGSYTATSASCQVSGISTSSYNGQWVEWLIPIPSNYTCNQNDPFGCWIKLTYSFNGGVHDVTSWSAALDGNPVRIVQ